MKNKYLIYIFLIVFLGCKKRTKKISWNGNYILPVSTDTVNLSKLIGSDNLYLSNDGTHNIYTKSVEVFKLQQKDFLPDFNFTVIDTLEIPSFIYGVPFPPGFEIPISYNESQILDFGDVKLNEINFNNLKLKYSVKSNINGIMYLIINIPTAKNNIGNDFTDTLLIPNTNGVLDTYEGSIYLDNYIFDFSNSNSTFNHLATSIRFGYSTENTQNTVLNSNDFISIDLTLEDLNIRSLSGYLGNKEISDTSEIRVLFTDNLSSKNIEIEDPELKLSISNGIGVDAQIKINEVIFNKDEDKLPLQHPTIGQTINLSRANNLGANIQFGYAEILFTNQNSNLNDLISFFPETVDLNYDIEINPMGNHSAYNDFYNDSLSLVINSDIKIPLKFNVNDLKFTDTVSLSLTDQIQPNNLLINIDVINEFPVNCCFAIKFLNGDSLIMDSNCVSSAIINDYGIFSEATTSQFQIYLDNEKTDFLINDKKFIFEITFNSPDTILKNPILNNQNIYYKIDLELDTQIEIN